MPIRFKDILELIISSAKTNKNYIKINLDDISILSIYENVEIGSMLSSYNIHSLHIKIDETHLTGLIVGGFTKPLFLTYPFI